MDGSPLILAMDTALGGCSAAVACGGEVVAMRKAEASGQQSRLLVPLIEETLAAAATGYRELSAVAVTLGPGGFTSIRVALSTARAIALAAALPLIGLTTLEAMAAMQPDGDALALIDAYRGQFYAQRFHVTGGLPMPVSEAMLVEGSNLAALSESARVTRAPADAGDVARLAARKWQGGERVFSASPVYIRAPDAKLPATAGLKLRGKPL